MGGYQDSKAKQTAQRRRQYHVYSLSEQHTGHWYGKEAAAAVGCPQLGHVLFDDVFDEAVVASFDDGLEISDCRGIWRRDVHRVGNPVVFLSAGRTCLEIL